MFSFKKYINESTLLIFVINFIITMLVHFTCLASDINSIDSFSFREDPLSSVEYELCKNKRLITSFLFWWFNKLNFLPSYNQSLFALLFVFIISLVNTILTFRFSKLWVNRVNEQNNYWVIAIINIGSLLLLSINPFIVEWLYFMDGSFQFTLSILFAVIAVIFSLKNTISNVLVAFLCLFIVWGTYQCCIVFYLVITLYFLFLQ